MNRDWPTVTLAPRDDIAAEFMTAAEADAAASARMGAAMGNLRDEHESFERCDTDGALSQWGHSRMHDKNRLSASLARSGDRHDFPALFTLDGRLIDAREVHTPYGWAWVTSEGEFVNESRADDPNRARAANAAKGFYVGTVNAPARADLQGGNMFSVHAVIERTNPRSWADVIVTDNGHTVTTIPTPAEAADGAAITDRPWTMPRVATSVQTTRPDASTVVAAYVPTPGATPATDHRAETIATARKVRHTNGKQVWVVFAPHGTPVTGALPRKADATAKIKDMIRAWHELNNRR